MKLRIRKLISLIAFAILVFAAGACNQQNSPTDRQSSTGAVAAGSDQAALAEAVLAVLFIAGKRARDSGECDQGEQRLDRRSGEDRRLERLLCDRLARQEAKRGSSEQGSAPKGVAIPL